MTQPDINNKNLRLMCTQCGDEYSGCYKWDEKQQKLLLSHWWCQNCNKDTRATGREFQIEPEVKK